MEFCPECGAILLPMNKKLKWSFKLLLIDKQILKLGAKIYERFK